MRCSYRVPSSTLAVALMTCNVRPALGSPFWGRVLQLSQPAGGCSANTNPSPSLLWRLALILLWIRWRVWSVETVRDCVAHVSLLVPRRRAGGAMARAVPLRGWAECACVFCCEPRYSSRPGLRNSSVCPGCRCRVTVPLECPRPKRVCVV